jgi:predicted RNA-binding Zn-ribbon protein involved in translation (DUF1610 family)
MANKNRVICPDCGVEMNHHANKIDYSNDAPGEIDSELGGTIEETHICPECGKTVMRRPAETRQVQPRITRRLSYAYRGIL